MCRVGSVWVCSSACRDAKLKSTAKRRVQRETDRKSEIDKGPIREAVKQRDGNFCLLCGDPSSLHLHRVKYGSEGGRYEIGNTVLLCNRCHVPVVHANKKVWQRLLLDHLAGVPGARAALRLQSRADR